MYTPKTKTKRVLGLALAAALALAGTVALAGNSQAVTTPVATATPNTGDAAGGTVVTLKGKGFADVTNAPLALAVTFNTAVCPTTIAGTAATNYNVVSATTITATAPVIAAGADYVCVYDAAAGAANILGQATYTAGVAPAITSLTAAAAIIVTEPTVGGGTPLVINGTGFTAKTKISIGGVAAKTTYVSAIKLTAVVPAHAAGVGVLFTVTSEYGTQTPVVGTASVTYVPQITAVPSFGTGVASNVVSLTGAGFSGYTFGAATGNYVVVFVPGGTTLVANTTVIATALNPCTSVIVVSDKSLTCQAPALSGGYTAMIIARGATAANYGSSVTGISRSATYTASSF